MITLEQWLGAAAAWVWDLPLLLLLTGGGLFFLLQSKLLPFRHFFHGIAVLTGRYDHPDDAGQVSHYQALSVALASTIGMGNISGVALAMWLGGPGVIFWMWISALVGMATKYYECSLAVMFRGRDSAGELQGGPMYVITEGLGRRWRPLATLFSAAGMFACLPMFAANQLTQAINDIVVLRVTNLSPLMASAIVGVALSLLTAVVVFGGLKRISHVTSALVPLMVVLYFVAVLGILGYYYDQVPRYLRLIFTDAFEAKYYGGQALFGGTLAGLIVYGARRAAFSNEAGLGTAPMAHGAAKTSQPVHEGLVAMLGPAIDTLFICTLTALAILVTGVWQTSSENGITLAANAFESAYPGFGSYLLLLCILCFGLSSLFSSSYYGAKCVGFLFGAHRKRYYPIVYTISIVVASTLSIRVVLNFIDLTIAFMAVPTMTSSLLLSGRVRAETRRYFSALVHGSAAPQAPVDEMALPPKEAQA